MEQQGVFIGCTHVFFLFPYESLGVMIIHIWYFSWGKSLAPYTLSGIPELFD